MPENKALGHRRANDRLVAELDRIGEYGDARAMEEFGDATRRRRRTRRSRRPRRRGARAAW